MIQHILVVEDDQDIREIIEYILSDSGYQVNTAATAEEFFKRIKVLHPDLILLDIRLPDGDGRELCKVVKSNIRTKGVPVIMMSAHMDVSKNLKELGANDFIPKPFDIDHLVKKVGMQLHSA